MELIKIKRHFQITLPQALRAKLKLAVGDYVEAYVENGELVIRPVKVVRSEEGDAAFALLDEIHAKMKGEDPEEMEKLIAEAIREVRKQQ